MRRPGSNGGFTLIDAVLAIVIITASFMAMGSVISTTTMQNVDVDMSSTAILLARGKMAEVMARDFDSIATAAQTPFSGDFAGYSSAVNVSYVGAADLDAAAGGPTDYKKVEVVVTHGAWVGAIRLFDLKVKMQ